jgi:hypothetical protein
VRSETLDHKWEASASATAARWFALGKRSQLGPPLRPVARTSARRSSFGTSCSQAVTAAQEMRVPHGFFFAFLTCYL